ncbi:capsid cement protein [Cerasicoccus maritimus]|uniref:capsid cement protein n=1 Tax=Cerasicoccus maritimus TaxID=490089 RepID=UPI002852AE43|nr:capsid cement protein [Cerasicoccus maritimus]
MNTLNDILRALFGSRPVFANVATGVHEGGLTRKLSYAISERYLLGAGTLSESEVTLCGSDQMPLGVITDSGSAGDYVNVAPLGNASSTLLMVASEAITAGSPVYVADDGQVQNEPEFAGEYYHVGHALSSASTAGDLIEVIPQTPAKTIIIDAFTGTASSDIASLGAALADAPDKVIVLS